MIFTRRFGALRARRAPRPGRDTPALDVQPHDQDPATAGQPSETSPYEKATA